MGLSTYAELQEAVVDWLNKPDVAQSVPTLISLAEADINRRLRHIKMQKRSVASIDTQYYAVPSDWLETLRFSTTGEGSTQLDLISHAELLDRSSRARGTAGKPLYYAMTGTEFELYPAPDATYSSELVYYGRIPALADDNTSNWLLTEAPDVYLYGALTHSAPFLGEDARLAVWSSMYTAAIDGLSAASESSLWGGTGLKMNIRSY